MDFINENMLKQHPWQYAKGVAVSSELLFWWLFCCAAEYKA